MRKAPKREGADELGERQTRQSEIERAREHMASLQHARERVMDQIRESADLIEETKELIDKLP
jgi:hypothetical protein